MYTTTHLYLRCISVFINPLQTDETKSVKSIYSYIN